MLTLSLKSRAGSTYAISVKGEEAQEIPGAFINQFSYVKYYSEIPPTRYALEKLVEWCENRNVQLEIPTPVLVQLNREDHRRTVFTGGEFTADDRLYQHQKEGVQFLIENKEYNNGVFRVLVADDPRLGKSAQTLVALKQGTPGRVLVLCPKALLYQWEEYINTWFVVPQLQVLRLEGTEKQRLEKFKAFMQFEVGGWQFVLTNWESLYMKSLDLINFSWEAVIGDEAHRLKSRTSKISLAMKRIKTNSIFLLSATFVEHLPVDWWSPLNIIAPDRYSSYWRFAGHYVHSNFDGYGIGFTSPKDTDIMKDDVKPYILQRKSDDVANMPEKIYETLYCEMEDWHKAFYIELQKKTRVELSEGTLTMPNVISRITRLRQASIHPVLLDAAFHEKGYETGKLAMLRAFIEDTVPPNEQAIIYCSFIEGCRAAHAVLADSPSFIYAGDHAHESDIEKFQKGEHRIMISTIGKGGIGLNLFNANYVIFLDMPFSTVQYRQAEERVRAVGKSGSVYVVKLATVGTIDSYVNRLVEGKIDHVTESEIIINIQKWLLNE